MEKTTRAAAVHPFVTWPNNLDFSFRELQNEEKLNKIQTEKSYRFIYVKCFTM